MDGSETRRSEPTRPTPVDHDESTAGLDERFRALADHAPELIAEFDVDGRYLYANPSYRLLLGYDPAELTGRRPGPLIHPDDHALQLEKFRRALATEGESRSIHRLLHREGTWRWFDNTGRAFRTRSGALRFVSIGRDITARKEMEEALARQLGSEQRLLALSRRFLGLRADEIEGAIPGALADTAQLARVEHAHLVAFRDDPAQAQRTYASGDAISPLECARLPWLAQRLRAGDVLHHPRLDDLPPQAASDRAYLEERGARSLLAIPIHSAGALIGVVAFEARLTERHWSGDEITLLQLAAELIGSALHRRHVEEELEESRAQLVQAQKMEAVGRLAGGVAHDFNNLLMVISGFGASLVERLPLEHKAREDAQEITSAVERASALTRQLLTLSRRQVVARQRVDLNSVVRGLSDILERLLGEHVTLGLQLAPELPVVEGDPGQLEQVLVNLAVNARDAMPLGGLLRVSTELREIGASEARRVGLARPGAHAVLSLIDTGSGMDEATQARVFEPFFTTKEPGKGTGLGLSIVYGIVRQCDGVVTLWSELNRGTAVHIYLPAATRAPERASVRTAPDFDALGSETVLLAEDESPLRRLLRRLLEQRGYRVLEARDGVEALSMASQHDGPIHLLVTDVVMPRMGGLALARRLRQQRGDVRVLFVSGHPQDRTGGEGEFTHDGFLQKPCAPAEILEKVRHILDA